MLRISILLFLVLINILSSSGLEDNSNKQGKVLESYRYNHPPSFEPHNIQHPDERELRKIRDVENINDGSTVVRRRKVKTQKVPVKIETPVEVKPTVQNEIASREFLTERPISTSPSPRTVVPKVFTKRPPEFNPVMKRSRQREPVVKIVEESNFVYGHSGNFHYSYEGADGTRVSSVGELKSFNDDKTGEAVAGEVFYKDNEGNDVSLTYTADENGYRPQGAHLPTPPPIPIEIARALKVLETKSTPEFEVYTESTNKMRKVTNRY